MEKELNSLLALAKTDNSAADKLIRSYIPFIKAAVSKVIKRICTEQDDEYSIGLMAFHEAILSYNLVRGSFLNYAQLSINSRVIDYLRKEQKHKNLTSLDEEDEEERPLHESLSDKKDAYSESDNLAATKEEIKELALQLSSFGLSFTDIAENSPKQERTLKSCAKVVEYAKNNAELLNELLKTKRLPLAALCLGTGEDRKTLERHRKYLMAMLIIQTNGYEIIRGHLSRKFKGGAL